jgi:L-arabinose isomerase
MDQPSIGVFVSALLEDEWNKGAEFRPKAASALDGMVRSLGSLGRIVNPGLVETLEQARAARERFLREDVDLVLAMQLCFTQGVVPLKALLDFPRPLLVWNTQLLRTLPADAGWDTILVNSGVTGIPEFTSALVRSGRRFFFVSGHFDDERCRREIGEYAVAAHVARRLANARIGIIGHPYKWMTDLMVDQLTVIKHLGVITDCIEEGELSRATRSLEGDSRVDGVARELAAAHKVSGLSRDLYLRSVRYALALERVVKEHGVDGLAFFEQGLLDDDGTGITAALGMSRLFGAGVPCTSEADLLTVVVMLVQQWAAGPSTFLEHYGMDFDENTALLAHDSFGNLELAADPAEVSIEPSIFYKGSAGYGAALRFRYRPGEVTLASLFPGPPGGPSPFRMIVSEGVSRTFAPRPIPAPQMLFAPDIGDIDAFYRGWCTLGGPHHLAGCYGRHTGVLVKLAEVCGLDARVI